MLYSRVLIPLSIVIVFALTTLLGRSGIGAGEGCFDDLSKGSQGYWSVEKQDFGWPAPWLSIYSEGCFEARTRTYTIIPLGLLISTAIGAGTGIAASILAARRRQTASAVNPATTV
jgi:hypothetical protein